MCINNCMFESISKLRFIFGMAAPVPTVLNVEPSVMENKPPKIKLPRYPIPGNLPCFEFSAYWISLLEFWEAYKPYRYRDSRGFWTVGIGTLIDTKKVSEAEIRRKLGSYYTAVMDGIERDTDPNAFSPGSRNGNSPLKGTNQSALPHDVAVRLAQEDLKNKYRDLISLFGIDTWSKFPYAIQCVLAALAYQTNVGNLTSLVLALKENPPNYKKAASRMRSFDWYNQTQPDRRDVLVQIMESGGKTAPSRIGEFTAAKPETALLSPCVSTDSIKPNLPSSLEPNWPSTVPETIMMD